MASCGYCAPVPPGKICPNGIHRTKHATGGFNSGSDRVFSNVSPRSWPKTYTNETKSISAKRSWMGPSRRQKGDLFVGKTKRGKGSKITAIADASGIPFAARIESASPHEERSVEATKDSGFTQYAPDKLIGDKACDSDGLD